jgi:hypothetical protein
MRVVVVKMLTIENEIRCIKGGRPPSHVSLSGYGLSMYALKTCAPKCPKSDMSNLFYTSNVFGGYTRTINFTAIFEISFAQEKKLQ